MLAMYRSMLGQRDPTRAALIGVKVEEFKPAGKSTHMCFEITTWTELVPGDHPPPGCITPEEATALYDHCLRNATWFDLHHDLHPGNVLFWRNENGEPVIMFIDFGHHIEASGCPGDTSAFSYAASEFVSPLFCCPVLFLFFWGRGCFVMLFLCSPGALAPLLMLVTLFFAAGGEVSKR